MSLETNPKRNSRNGNGVGPLRKVLEQARLKHGYSMTELTVLATQNDPYRQDTPAGHEVARWFAEQLERFVPDGTVHLRGLHYLISSASDVLKVNGLPYQNTDTDWTWLQSIANRIAAAAPPPARKHDLVTSDRLHALGIELMDCAVTATKSVGRTGTRQAIQYRDGLIISTLAMIPLRRGTLAALQIGRHLIKVGDHWALDIPAVHTKNRRPLDYSIPKDLSARIDLYLERFRPRIRGSDKHAGLWPSHHSIPMRRDSINFAVGKRTRKAFGFAVNLHRFRHAAASFWSIHDPVNVRGVKDLLGHTTFATTEQHYIMAQSRLAGQALAQAIGELLK